MNFSTTFYQDFSIADAFGIEAIKDTYKRAFGEWKFHYKYLTALVMTLNWKIFEHYQKSGESEITLLHDRLWREADTYAMDNLKGEELSYFLRETD